MFLAPIYMLSQGHDYLGRSSGPSSLQVLTHNLNSVAYIVDFVPQGSSAAPVPALTIGAGAQLDASEHILVHLRFYSQLALHSVYSVVEAHNVLVVLGDCLTVGAGT